MVNERELPRTSNIWYPLPSAVLISVRNKRWPYAVEPPSWLLAYLRVTLSEPTVMPGHIYKCEVEDEAGGEGEGEGEGAGAPAAPAYDADDADANADADHPQTSTSDVRGAADLLASAGTWRSGAREYSRTMRDFSQRVARSTIQSSAREGTLGERMADAAAAPPLMAPGGTTAAVRKGEAFLAYVVGADGSVAGNAQRMAGAGKTVLRAAVGVRDHGARAMADDGDGASERAWAAEAAEAAGHYRPQRATWHSSLLNLTRAHRRLVVRALRAKSAKGSHPPEMRRSHRRLHDALVLGVPWHRLAPALRAHAAGDAALMRWWAAGAVGTPPAEADSLVTQLVGHHVPPTSVGRMLRRVGHAMVHGELQPWEADGSLAHAAADHRHARHGPDEDEEDEPWRTTHSFFDGRRRTGVSRRLAEDFGLGIFGGRLSVPSSKNSTFNATLLNQSAANFIEQGLSYLVYNVFLCYLYKPDLEGSADSGTGYASMKVVPHRSTHACFPAIPFDLPELQNFSYYTGVDPTYWRNESKHHRNDEGVLDDLDYYRLWCHTTAIQRANATAKHLAGMLGIDLNRPSGKAFRRLIENPVAAVTSFENLGRAFTLPAGSRGKMLAVTCAFTRLNAIIWFVCMIVVFMGFYLTCCWPCFNLASIFIYFICCCGLLRSGNRKRDVHRARAASKQGGGDDRKGGGGGSDGGEGVDDGDDGGGKSASGGGGERSQTIGAGRRGARRRLPGRYPGLPKEHSLAELWTAAEPGGGGPKGASSTRARIEPEGTLYGTPVQRPLNANRV